MMKTEKCIAKKTISVFRFAVMVGMVGFTQIAYSATASGPMSVSATVSSSCVVGTSTLAFGSATSAAITAGNVDATGTVTVNCTSGSTYSVALDAGAGTGATIAIRKMSAGAQSLSYTIYSDTGRTTIWGNGTLASVPVAGTGTGTVQSISAYGRIFAGQNVTAVAYADTINVTITY
ncbi:Csu type fimbrial protein [Undibacterium sp. RuRC25W]|uniref:Csu type fimbrial protein n=1 Tax=Undibacterium sp. RuRC25W TaxID=3413047 RepID=UPI003BF32771